ncbi:MAG: nitroreductase family protein [Parasutterella sp.]|uniref:nitroreductase family protein n=1 Tax=Parasutterella sp. TaxID=2049037 RepID=UPI00300F315B
MDFTQMHDSVLERVTLRRSLGAKYLTTPAPTKEDYDEALTWAIAAPDHCRLSPARFVVIEERQKFADFFEAGALAEGADQEGAERARSKALKAPAMVAVVAKIDEHNARVPAYEQWMTVGAATSNFLAALAGRTHQKLSNEPRYRSPFIGDLTRGTF